MNLYKKNYNVHELIIYFNKTKFLEKNNIPTTWLSTLYLMLQFPFTNYETIREYLFK